MGQRLRDLDNQVLGRPVPDDRPLWQRVQRSRPAVWSTRGRLIYGLLLVGMFALVGNDSVLGIVAFLVLFAGLFVTVAADERKRAQLFYEGEMSSALGQIERARLPGGRRSGSWMRPGSRPFRVYWGVIAVMVAVTAAVATTVGGWWVAIPVVIALSVEYGIDRLFRGRSNA